MPETPAELPLSSSQWQRRPATPPASIAGQCCPSAGRAKPVLSKARGTHTGEAHVPRASEMATTLGRSGPTRRGRLECWAQGEGGWWWYYGRLGSNKVANWLVNRNRKEVDAGVAVAARCSSHSRATG